MTDRLTTDELRKLLLVTRVMAAVPLRDVDESEEDGYDKASESAEGQGSTETAEVLPNDKIPSQE